MKMETSLKILTLNCWGIPVISANRRERITAIAYELSAGDYDLVALQEIWSQRDYEYIAKKIQEAFPYSHYFHSGVIGAGICIFSKGPIVDAHYQRWALNGYAHKIFHGDWFGGKGTGLCKILYRGLKINFYTAHLHAEYNRKRDVYLSHRMCQAFDLSQFVRATGETSDVNILAGDLNTEPTDLPYKIVRYNANLLDSACESEEPIDTFGATNEHPRNFYTSKAGLKTCPTGKRIDYVFYSYNEGTSVSCTSCRTPLDKCPNFSFSFSDHEAVVCTLRICKEAKAPPMPRLVPEHVNVLTEMDAHLSEALKSLVWDQRFYFIVFALLLCTLVSTVHVSELPYGLQTLLAISRIILTLLMSFCGIMGIIWNRTERNGILSALKVSRLLLHHFANDTINEALKEESSESTADSFILS